MDEENKFTRNPDEGDGGQPGPTQLKDEGMLKKVLSVVVDLSCQVFALAKKKFDEAGGIEGIRKKIVAFGSEVKAGFVPDADKAGFKRLSSWFIHLWEIRKSEVIYFIVGILILSIIIVMVGWQSNNKDALETNNALKRPKVPEPINDIYSKATTSPLFEPIDVKDETVIRNAPSTEMEVNITEFDSEFRQNRLAFEQKYNGHTIGLTGEITRIYEIDSVPIVTIDYSLSCRLKTSETEVAEQLDTNDNVRIVGMCEVDSDDMLFGSDNPRLIDCIVAEMPKKEMTLSSEIEFGSLELPITLGQLEKEFQNNSIRILRKYGGRQVFLRAKWNQVDKTYEGNPILRSSDLHTCTLRKSQIDTATSMDLSKEYLIRAVLEGRSFLGTFDFIDGEILQ